MPEVKMEQEEKIPACPVETTLMLISDKWKVLVQNLYSMRCQSGEKIIKT